MWAEVVLKTLYGYILWSPASKEVREKHMDILVDAKPRIEPKPCPEYKYKASKKEHTHQN